MGLPPQKHVVSVYCLRSFIIVSSKGTTHCIFKRVLCYNERRLETLSVANEEGF